MWSSPLIISFHLPVYKIITCPPGVYNCNVAPSLRCTGSNDIFPRSCHRLGGSVPLCFKIKLSVMRLKGPCVLCVTTKLLRPTKSQTAEGMAFGPQLTPLRSALFHTGDGTVRVRHHIATLESDLTRKEFRLIYMWTGF